MQLTLCFPKISDIIDNIKGITVPGNDVNISQTLCNNNLCRFYCIEIAGLEDEVIHFISAGVPPAFCLLLQMWVVFSLSGQVCWTYGGRTIKSAV